MESRSLNRYQVTRRRVVAVGAALPLCGFMPGRASAAEFSYKLATGQNPTHPVNLRAQEALTRIGEASKGRLEIKLFPANQLGSDTDLLSQVRVGGVEFFNLSTSILATFVSVSGIVTPVLPSTTTTRYGRPWTAISETMSAHKSPRPDS